MPHMLFVGMPSPFKETWVERYRTRLNVPVIIGVGGSFDVLAGYRPSRAARRAAARPRMGVATPDGAAQTLEAIPDDEQRSSSGWPAARVLRAGSGEPPSARSGGQRDDRSGKKILVFMGTRPEAIKLAPVVAALQRATTSRARVVATGQHKEMFRQVADQFGIAVDADLDVMRPNQTLAGLTARLMTSDRRMAGRSLPTWRSCRATPRRCSSPRWPASIAASPSATSKPGLRTGNIWSPFPEEANRRLATPLVTLHFAPDRVRATGAAARRRPG